MPRFNQQNYTGNNNENSGPLSVEEHSGNSVARTTSFSGSLISTLTPVLINDFRFQYGRDRDRARRTATSPRRVFKLGGGFLQLGRNNFSPRETTIKRVQLIEGRQLRTRQSQPEVRRGSEFRSRSNFLQGARRVTDKLGFVSAPCYPDRGKRLIKRGAKTSTARSSPVLVFRPTDQLDVLLQQPQRFFQCNVLGFS
ncbi:MAG TPA: hypothetical protein VF435_15840 [Pyrinomonadaceae bacterium]